MQTPKPRVSVEVPQRTSPDTSPTSHQGKTPGADSDSVSSPNPASHTPKGSPKPEGSPKVVGRSPRSPASEKKGSGRVSELESQLANLQEELNKAEEQLSQSESWKKWAQQEAEDAKKQLAAMSAKLEESQNQLKEIYASEEARLQVLRTIYQERDRELNSELYALQKRHSMDSAPLASAQNEIQKLKIQLERVSESEVEERDRENEESSQLRAELSQVKSENVQLSYRVEVAERSFLVEFSQSAKCIRSANELAKKLNSEVRKREAAELEKLRTSKMIEELQEKLQEKESKLQEEIKKGAQGVKYAISLAEMARASEREKGIRIAEMARVSEREKGIRIVGYLTEEADKKRREVALVTEQLDAAQAANSEMEAELRRFKAQSEVANSEMEAELRRLKVESDQ